MQRIHKQRANDARSECAVVIRMGTSMTANVILKKHKHKRAETIETVRQSKDGHRPICCRNNICVVGLTADLESSSTAHTLGGSSYNTIHVPA